MITSIAFAFVLVQPSTLFKIPIYNADQKTPAIMSYVSTDLPAGFREGRVGSGEISSSEGVITVTLLKSTTTMPTLLRNPKLKELKDFTTLRMVKWIGYRNSRPNGEDYKLDWNRYRVNFSLVVKDKKDVGALREALHSIIDGLVGKI